ncbi:Dymeclin domain-containing protein [Cephalotus follicularis]|uniref:Dymeclin n=1 Tax=Cephalotus follicularis TaxID=3775 RepID=A0A1Q3AP79_CEPFO|nr:Dymeclin domain-containing protein [Cephalotus follicularis]
MGAVPSTARAQDTTEYLMATFVGEKSFPLTSDFWQKLLALPLSLPSPSHRSIRHACVLLAENNCYTRHFVKILIHLSWCLQECTSHSGSPSVVYMKAVNAVHISSVFLKHLIENSQTENLQELYLSLGESEHLPEGFTIDQNIENLVMHSVLTFIGSVDISPETCILHQELLNFMLVAMSTQLLSGPSPGPKDVHPFIDAAMAQDSSLVSLVVRRLLLSYITRPRIPSNNSSYSTFSEESHPGVLQRVGSAAASFVLLPFNYLVSSSIEGSRNPLADCSLHVLLILIHYHKCVVADESITDRSDDSATSDSLSKVNTYFIDNPYCKALESARDIEFDRVDVEGNAHNGLLVRLPFASLFDSLGMSLADEAAVLLLYSLIHGNSDFLEYVLVRTDLDTLLMPILETLYNASKKTSNQIYMLLIVLLILSQDSSFNASIHKMILPSVPWYQEHLLHQTSLGSLMVIILIRTVKYNLSKLRDVYLHTTCLATLANMAPHVHRLSAYASQRLVSLFYMLSRKYNKLAELREEKIHMAKVNLIEPDNFADDMTAELHIYTDFLRIVLEIINAILTYALPRNPEVVYAVMHRQEVFQPFKSHPRFTELIENIFTVLDYFNSRMDAQNLDGEWSVEKVLQFIIINCRSWRGEGLKMFTQLHFSYEQESHPEEFFIPYVWQLVLSRCGFSFNPSAINLFLLNLPIEKQINNGGEGNEHQNGELHERTILFDP